MQPVAAARQPWSDQYLAAIASWRRANPGRIPALNREDRTEAGICRWLAAQNQRTDLSPADVLALGMVFPEWRRVRVSTFDLYLYETFLYVSSKKALPLTTSEDPGERRLGEWLARKASRDKDGTLLLSEVRALNEAIPAWRNAVRGESRITPLPKRKPKKKPRTPNVSWDDRMNQFAEFYREAHRTPIRSKPGEQVLAKWLVSQQKSIHAGELPVDRAHRLMSVISDSPVITFQPNAAEIEVWVESIRASESLGIIQAMWLEVMNHHYYRGELTEAQVEAIDSVDSTWREYRHG